MAEFPHKDVEYIARIIANTLKSPEILLTKHVEDIKQADAIIKGIKNIENTVETGCEENVRKQLKNCLISTRKLADILYFALITNIIYTLGGSIEKDKIEALSKLGAKSEALASFLFAKKMKGN